VGPDLRHAAYRCAEPVHSLASPPSPSKSTGGHSARAEPARSFTMDGEVVVCRPDGVAMFDALHRRGTITEAVLYAFDLLERDGEDRSADLKRNGLRSAGREDHRLLAFVSRARPDGKSRSAMSPAIFATCRGCPLR